MGQLMETGFLQTVTLLQPGRSQPTTLLALGGGLQGGDAGAREKFCATGKGCPAAEGPRCCGHHPGVGPALSSDTQSKVRPMWVLPGCFVPRTHLVAHLGKELIWILLASWVLTFWLCLGPGSGKVR